AVDVCVGNWSADLLAALHQISSAAVAGQSLAGKGLNQFLCRTLPHQFVRSNATDGEKQTRERLETASSQRETDHFRAHCFYQWSREVFLGDVAVRHFAQEREFQIFESRYFFIANRLSRHTKDEIIHKAPIFHDLRGLPNGSFRSALPVDGYLA